MQDMGSDSTNWFSTVLTFSDSYINFVPDCLEMNIPEIYHLATQ